VNGVTKGYERNLDINGVGFKAEVRGKTQIHFTLGFSHPVIFPLPEGVTAEVDAKQTRVTVRGVDKHLLGLTAAKIPTMRRQQVTIDVSEHFQFRNDVTAYRFLARAGGLPIPTSTYAYRATGTTKAQPHSPFVCINT
jgi:hypothetical protein